MPAPTQLPKSVVGPSPVMAFVGKVTVVSPQVPLHVTDNVYVCVVPLCAVAGPLIVTELAAAWAGPAKPNEVAAARRITLAPSAMRDRRRPGRRPRRRRGEPARRGRGGRTGSGQA